MVQQGSPCEAPIAIVGLGCVMPGAHAPEAFWENVLAGASALRPLRGGPWEWERLGLAPALAARVEGFTPDWRALRLPPADAAAMNPAQLQVLEAGRQALAGVRALPRERTGVWLGATGLGWQPDTGMRVRAGEIGAALREGARAAGVAPRVAEEALAEAWTSLEEGLRPASEEPVVNSAASIAAGRLATLFDLRGPHCAVDAGFASGLAALELACRALREGSVDCAVTGAVSELLSPAELVALSRMGVLATEAARPFDASADGTLPGEGAVLFAAKRLEDALRDGDVVHAVVLGVGSACDGAAAATLAPRADAIALSARRALAAAGVEPGTVGFLECHATGTPRGDAAEVAALGEAYGPLPAPLPLGSAKSLVGHLRGAAGAVGMLRAVLALRSGVVPAQAGFSRPARALDQAHFVVPTTPLPLAPRGGARCARAAVSALSLGGIAYHAVLEAHAPGPAAASARPRSAPAPEPIAVVGLGGVFPGAEAIEPFWKALLDGHDAVREIPPERWDAARHCDPDPTRLERSYSRLGAFVPTPAIDRRWRVPPASGPAIDPAHLLALRAAEEAVAGAGLEAGTWDRDRSGVFLGSMACQGRKLLAEVRFHLARLGARLRDSLGARSVPPAVVEAALAGAARRVEAALPPLDEDALAGWLGSVAAARIARRFGLRGPQLAIESACASTLAAVGAAVQALRDGACDTVLAGGVWGDMQPEFYVGCCRFSALSATGCTPFDARASGFVPGEGAGILVLRRLRDAERDGQRIHAVIRAVAGSSDGRGKSVLAPSAEGEALAMSRALAEAQVAPGLVDYVECHGTGTAVGDAAEIDACTRAYGRGRARPLWVGSVKSNVGHLLAAAGAPALVKAVLAVREGVLPPTLHFERPNPAIDFAAGPVDVVARTRRWEAPPGEPRRAGVSGFGLGGTNMHALLEQYRPAAAAGSARAATGAGARILSIAAAAGRDEVECLERLGRLADEARGKDVGAYLAALARSQRAAEGEAAFRAAVVAADPATLDAKIGLLARALSGGVPGDVLQPQGIYLAATGPAPQVAAIFPGQGSQYPNMLREAAGAFPSLGETLDEADRAYLALCGRPLRPALFADDAGAWRQSDEDIHCAVFVVNVALYRLLERHGLRPAALLGQSAGELAALVAAGALSFEEGLAAIRERTLSVLGLETSDPGRMVALACGAEDAARLVADLPGYAALAADNGPEACIVSGDGPAVAALVQRAAAAGVEASVLPVSHGYHSQLIGAARPRYLRHLARVPFRAPRVEVVSTVTGDTLAGLSPGGLPEHLASQFVEPVRLRAGVEALHARGVRLFVECGPKWPLTTFVGQILGDRPHVAQATLHPKVGEVEQLQRALACLFVHGAARLIPEEEHPMQRAPEPGALAPPPPESAEPPPDVSLLVLLHGIRDLIDGYLRRAEQRAAPAAHPRVSAAAAPAPRIGHAGADAQASHARRNGHANGHGHHAAHRFEVPVFPAQASPAPAPAPAHAPAPPAAAATPPPPPPATAAPGPIPQPAASPSPDDVRRALLDEYARRTGYPEEMLDPDLDLEAELGIDTVKQVAVLAAVRTRFALPPDPAFKLRDASTIAKAAAWLCARLGLSAQAPPAAPPAVPATSAAPAVPAISAAPVVPAAGAPAAALAPPRAPTLDEARATVSRLLVAEYARRTGYPEEMLDPELDLEAELGIDTVKQVAALGAVRQAIGLAPDPGFKLREARTIALAVEILARRLAGEAPRPPDPPASPRPPGGGAPRPPATAGVEPAAPAGAAGAGPRSATAARLLEAMLSAASEAGVREISAVAFQGAPGPSAPREPLVNVSAERDSRDALRLRAVLGGATAEATVSGGEPVGAAPAAPVEVLAALAPERRERACSGEELRRTLARVLGGADGLLGWARSDGFMVAAGGATLADGGAARRLATMISAAGELAAYAWLGLTGAPHALCAIERVRVHAVPPAGAELGFAAKMVPPEGGMWRADVRVVSAGRLVAELGGVAGTPVAAAAAGSGEDAAARAWRRFCRRMQGTGSADESVA